MNLAFTSAAYYNDSFPFRENDRVFIPREVELEEIGSLLLNNNIVTVSGEDGIGVTTLLSQFILQNSSNAISYFFNEFYTDTFSAEYFERCLMKQIYYVVHNVAMPDDCEDNLISIKSLFQQKIRQNSIFYLVIDGLDSVPVEYQDDVKHVLSKLPLQQFKILVSGDVHDIQWTSLSNSYISANKLLRFQKSAIIEYISKIDSTLSLEQLDTICAISKCIGFRLCHILDVIRWKGDVEAVCVHQEDVTANIFFFVDQIINSNERVENLLSFIVYSKFPLYIDVLKSLLKIEESEYNELLRSLDLLLVTKGNIIDFRDIHVKQYVYKKLVDYKMDAELALIKMLESDADFNPNLLSLYKDTDKKQTIVNLLRHDTIQQKLKDEKSQSVINIQCEYGYHASDDLLDLFKFAAIKSTSREVEKNELWDYEIEALVLSGKTDIAISLAQNVFLKEERLKCFAIIARYKDRLNSSQICLVQDTITHLVEDIEFDKIPDKSVELAKLLLPIDINTAMKIVERIVKDKQSTLSADRLYTILSLSLSENLSDSGKSDTSNFDEIKARIHDDNLKTLADSMRSVMCDSSSEDLIKSLERLPSGSQRLYILQFWIPEHKEQEGIEKVLNYAIQLIIADSGLEIPRACVLSDFCEALPYVKDERVLMELMSQISAVEDSVKYPTEQYVKIKLREIEAVSNFDIPKSIDMLTGLYVYIDDIPNVGTKINSFAVILSCYNKYAKDKNQLQEKWFTEAQLLRNIEDLIFDEYKETAYHFRLIQKSIECLVCDYPSFVFDVVDQINTEERRSKAYLMAAVEYVKRTSFENIDVVYLKKLVNSVKIVKEFQSRPYIYLAGKFARMKSVSNVERTLTTIKSFTNDINILYDEEDKCLILSNILIGLYNLSPNDSYIQCCSDMLYNTWHNMPDIRLKLLLGFRLYKRLHQCPMPIAQTILDESVKLKEQSILSTSSSAVACEVSLDLYTRSIVNLILAKGCLEDDLNDLKMVLERLDDVGESMVVWSRVMLAYDICGDSIKSKDIFKRYVLPHISVASQHTRYSHYVMFHISPALFRYSEELFISQLKNLPEYLVDVCLNNVCGFVFQQFPYIEDMDGKETFSIEYDNLLCLIRLLQEANDDIVIFNNISSICQSLIARKNRSLTTDQINNVLVKLEDLVDKIFPTKNGIQHKGYKLACKVAIRGVRNMLNNPSIAEIKSEIESVPNKADKAFLYFYAAQFLPKLSQQNEFIDAGIAISQTIPYGYDKYERFSFCIASCSLINQNLLKKSFHAFCSDMYGDKDSDYDYGEKIIDLAYQYNEDWADKYVQMCDKDPGRLYNKQALHRCLDRKKMLQSANKDFDKVCELPRAEYMNFFAKRYTGECFGRIIDAPDQKLIPIVKSIFEQPLSISENAIKYILRRSKSRSIVVAKKLHEVMSMNMKLALSLSAMSQSDIEKLQHNSWKHKLEKDDALILPGDGERARERILTWYMQKSYEELFIIDPYFGLDDLKFIKSFFDRNNTMRICVLTHAKDIDDMDAFQTEWTRNFDEITGKLIIKKVVYQDKPDDGPLHDRYWISCDHRSHMVGLQSNSNSGLGIHVSSISVMPDDLVQSIWEKIAEDLFYYEDPFFMDRKLQYSKITIS